MKNKIIGQISINTKGKGFIQIEGQEDSIPVEPTDIFTSLPGDTVEAETYTGFKDQTYAKVTKIIERKKTEYVGLTIIDEETKEKIIVPDNVKAYVHIVFDEHENFGQNHAEWPGANMKVLVKIETENWLPEYNRMPHGHIVKVIGPKGANDVEMESIVIERGFDITFNDEIVEEAEQASDEFGKITPDEIAKRKDFRETFTCTIDPVDAKDFDDALSFKTLPDGNYEIGVHIADVSHFVRPGTALDREARKRAFSVYLVDRTIPMLPSVLSNGACSLNPNEDKFAFSSVFTISPKGEVLDKWFGKTVIHSDKRFSYEEAQEVLNSVSEYAGTVAPSEKAESSAPSSAPSENANIDKIKEVKFAFELTEFNRLAKIMQAERKKKGAIDFETEEIKFKLDESGRPIAVYKKARLDTHKLVEEFMLLANREVAEFIHEKNKIAHQEQVGVYRVHDMPDFERLNDLSIFVHAMGFDFTAPKPGGKIAPRQIQDLINQVEGSPAEAVIKIATLRSMAKAAYATNNVGHFGLAFEYYTHFTSPIRRYPDLMVHRILSIILEGKQVPHQMAVGLERICLDSSKKEVEAADAERASIKYKQVEFMQERVGQIFECTVSGIADWGMFIEEPEAKAEGLIRIKDLKPQDYYIVDQKLYKIVGENTKKTFSIGDKVRAKLLAADLDSRILSFDLVE